MTFDEHYSSEIPGSEADEPTARRGGKKEGSKDLPRVLRCLIDEHRHLNSLIRALERKARQKDSLEVGDYYLLRDIAGYLHDYPDRVHHPTENFLFEKLLQRVPSSKRTITGLRRDHQAVAAETRSLLELLEKVIDKPDISLEQLIRQSCLDFVNHQRNHMQFENQKLFPAAIESLSNSDWKQIESRFAAEEDPLFGRIVGSNHRLLYEYLINPADKATRDFGISRLFSLDRLILTAELLEKNSVSSCTRLRILAEVVSKESRMALAKFLKPKNLANSIGVAVNYSTFLNRSLLNCSGDLMRISSITMKDALALYSRRNPAK